MHRAAGFFRQYVSNPARTGAIAPSSAALAQRMLSGLPLEDADVVVELGPGSGALTHHIIDQVADRARILTVEINPIFAEQLAQRFPQIEVVHGDAVHLDGLLRHRGLNGTPVIISGLPWAAFEPGLQGRLLDAVARALRPGGCFVTFAYWGMHRFKKGRLFREQIESRFSRVERTRLVWGNLPPAFAYYCWR